MESRKQEGQERKRSRKKVNIRIRTRIDKDVVCWYCGKEGHPSAECCQIQRISPTQVEFNTKTVKENRRTPQAGVGSLEQGDQVAVSDPNRRQVLVSSLDPASIKIVVRSPHLDPRRLAISAFPPIASGTEASESNMIVSGVFVSDRRGLCKDLWSEFPEGENSDQRITFQLKKLERRLHIFHKSTCSRFNNSTWMLSKHLCDTFVSGERCIHRVR